MERKGMGPVRVIAWSVRRVRKATGDGFRLVFDGTRKNLVKDVTRAIDPILHRPDPSIVRVVFAHGMSVPAAVPCHVTDTCATSGSFAR